MTLGDNIHNMRIEKNLTIQEFSQKTRTPIKHLVNIESGKEYPTLYLIRKLATALNVNETTLLTGCYSNCNLLQMHLTEDNPIYHWIYFTLASKERDAEPSYFASLQSLSKHILKEMGEQPIKNIDVFSFNDLYAKMYDQNFSKKTIKGVKGVAQAMFQIAIDLRILSYNPVLSSKIPKKASNPIETKIISEKIQKIIIEFEHPMQLPAMIMLFAGLRRGELMALQFSDINIAEGYIDITKSSGFKRGKPHLKTPKTKSGTRRIDIPDILRTHLLEYLSEKKPDNSDFVFSDYQGNLVTERFWQREWNNYQEAIKSHYGEDVERFTSKQLRHTYCTLLYNADINVKTAQEWMGHSDIKITLDFYIHLDKYQKKKSINKLNDFIKQRGFE